MISFGSILVGLDLHPKRAEVCAGSRAAFSSALRMAKEFESTLVLMHSTHRRSRPNDAKAALDALVAEAKEKGVAASTKYSDERAWLALIRESIAGGHDLVILGKRSEADHDGIRLGDVASKMLRKCPKPVLVIDPARELAFNVFVSAMDFSPVGTLATELTAELTKRFKGEMHVAHAFDLPFEIQMQEGRLEHKEYAELVQKEASQHRTQVEETLSSLDTGANKPTVHVQCNRPSATIVHTVDEADADLVVMGTVTVTGLAGFLVGSTADRVLPRVKCAVLAIKPEGFESPIK